MRRSVQWQGSSPYAHIHTSKRCWNSEIDKMLNKMGFVQSASDPCIYICKSWRTILHWSLCLWHATCRKEWETHQWNQVNPGKEIPHERSWRAQSLPQSRSRAKSQKWHYLDWTINVHQRSAKEIWYGKLLPLFATIKGNTTVTAVLAYYIIPWNNASCKLI